MQLEQQIILNRTVPEPNTGCWLWTGATNQHGYGHLRLRKKYLKAHRVSYRAHVGDIPAGMYVCHRCDTPACCNPDHLFLGTPRDNIHDMVAKGRNVPPRGERSGFTPFLERDILEIRRLREAGQQLGTLAKNFNVSVASIHAIVCRKTWAHLA